MLSLTELARTAPERPDFPPEAARLAISGIAVDSRGVKPGFLFAALRGEKSDGAKFIPQAKHAGAVAVLCDKDAEVTQQGIVVIRAHNPRRLLAHMAAAFYGRQPAHMAAITGTDGKTSTADFFRQFWHHLDASSASIGTLGILSGGGELLAPGTHTTPDPVALHRMLADMAAKGVTHVAMEASSHGLDQYRLDGVALEAAAFTNIARDHLDYHKNEDAYFAAKLRLFSDLLPKNKIAVLNEDDVKFAAVKAACERRGHNIIGFGRKGAQFRIVELNLHPRGQKAKLELFGKSYALDVPLVGAFQLMNILAALGLVVGTGGNLEKALAAVALLKGVPGRLEKAAELASGASVFVDYAHTPMALANILNTLKPHTAGKLHVVFGCGGDRDPGKRSQMGEIAAALSDHAIITDDNPRSENPAAIRKAILAASPRAIEIGDRREAISAALKKLKAGDVLVVAGKGHEKTQTVGDKIFPFDDVQVVREAAQKLKLAL